MQNTKTLPKTLRFPHIHLRPALPRPHLPSRPDSIVTFCANVPEKLDDTRLEAARMVNKMF